MYAGASGRGVFKTVDGGATWRRVTTGKLTVETLTVDPQNGSIVFAGTTHGLVRSTDGGETWAAIATPPGAAAGDAVRFVDPRRSRRSPSPRTIPRVVYAGIRSGGVLKSSDGGDTWTASNAGLPDRHIASLAVDPRDPQVVYAANESGLFRSTTEQAAGTRFARDPGSPGVTALAIGPPGETVFAGTQGDGVVGFQLGR